jgi:hypothetical protein
LASFTKKSRIEVAWLRGSLMETSNNRLGATSDEFMRAS